MSGLRRTLGQHSVDPGRDAAAVVAVEESLLHGLLATRNMRDGIRSKPLSACAVFGDLG